MYAAESWRVETFSRVVRWSQAASIEADRDQRTGDMARDMRCCVVPGAADAWLTALDRYGTLSFAEVAADAIALCERGFPVYDVLAGGIALREESFREWTSSGAVFMPKGRPPRIGEPLVEADLGRTLRRLAEAEAAGARAGGRRAGLQAARDL